ncbi:MAG TPA: hypothetical protein VGQ44_17160 [Gemmatimonadaceae bacterium]|jgi:hypothetical protein|nr:hypothetical protein [Gemmatimonadaceae bacterium]
MNQLGYEATVRAMRERQIPEEKIQKFAREQWPEVAAEQDAAAVKVEARREKDVEHAGDKLMLAHGFRVISFSQPRATKQTAGISDRLYINAKRRLAVFWEAKTSTGKQSPHQRDFQALVESVDWTYVVGTDAVLGAYLNEQGVLIK